MRKCLSHPMVALEALTLDPATAGSPLRFIFDLDVNLIHAGFLRWTAI